MTRPEPTIYGNCDSWDFIVGRKPAAGILKEAATRSFKVKVTIFIHRLFTIFGWLIRDNLWVNCGRICTSPKLTP